MDKEEFIGFLIAVAMIAIFLIFPTYRVWIVTGYLLAFFIASVILMFSLDKKWLEWRENRQ